MSAILVAALIAAAAPTPVDTITGHFQCQPRAQLIGALQAEGKVTMGRGISDDGLVLEMWLSRSGAEFVIIVTLPGASSSCIIFGGDWQ